MHRIWPIVALSLLACWSTALATSTSTLVLDRFPELSRGSGPSAVALSSGSLIVGPRAQIFAESAESQVWDLARLEGGDFLAGTGHEGKVLRISADRQVTTLFNSPELEIHSLAVGPAGEVYAGSSPDGLVYRIEPDGSASTWFDTGQTYVWDLAFFEGKLFAATGPEGKLFRIEGAGSAEVVFDADETHLTALAAAGARLLVGGGSEGRLYEIQGSRARVLFDGPEVQIVGIVPAATDGSVVFAASSGEAPPDAAKGANRLYRLQNDVVQSIWEAPVTPLFSIARRGDRIAVSAGDKGRIFLVSTDGAEVSTWLDGAQLPVSAMLDSPRGTVLGTGGKAGLQLLALESEPSATYLTEPLDTSRVSRFGKAWWSGSGAIEIRARSGNSENPDSTWSEWSAAQRDPQGSPVDVPPARFVQLEVLLAERTSRLERLELAYLGPNLAPLIQELIVHPAARGVFQQDPPQPQKVFTQSLPGGITLRYTLSNPDEQSRDGAGNWMRIAGMRTSTWKAQDPNRDALLFDLFLQGQDTGPILLARDWTDPVYTWDTTAFADGAYRLRLVASDRASNPVGLALEASVESELFSIDNSAPRVQRMTVTPVASGGWDIEASVTDEQGRIGGAEYTVDGKPIVPVFPLDSIFDSSSETFRFHVDTERNPGRLLLHVYDRDLNRASAQALLQRGSTPARR